MTTDQHSRVLEILTEYVSVRLLREENASGLTSHTPLLELGVLNSIETARLVAYIRETFGVRLPPTALTAGNFRNLETIAGMVTTHAPAPAGAPATAGLNGEFRG